LKLKIFLSVASELDNNILSLQISRLDLLIERINHLLLSIEIALELLDYAYLQYLFLLSGQSLTKTQTLAGVGVAIFCFLYSTLHFFYLLLSLIIFDYL